ncbi:protein of unknown function (DUF4782) [Castilleja foliolosa]|uniref:VASt domain-containing protein n=1 Tax=Castilleja foliolosa TaxID=1961234 RepID=A0ABD3EDB7_9LAMI
MAVVVSEKMVDPTPPISQSMDCSNSPRRIPDDSPSGSPELAAPDISSLPTPCPSRQLDLQNQQLSRVEEYRQLFRLPPDEVLIQDFNCALQENFLLQGHMYLFVHCICFYSNLFGFETKKIIPFHEITSVRRAKVVGVFPTAIEVIAAGKKYFFTSFLFRDEAFKLINEGWLHHNNVSPDVTEQQEPKSDISSQENGSSMVEESGSSRQFVDESEIIESDKNEPILEEPEIVSTSTNMDEPEIVSTSTGMDEPEIVSTSTGMDVREEVIPEADPVIECSLPSKSSPLESEDTDAPGVPEGYTKVAESKFPIRVEEFFNMFFSNEGLSFHESFHRKCGDKDFKCTSWQPHANFGHTRDVSFQHPIKLYFGARFGSCQEVQKYRVYRNCHLIVDTSQEISDVPYGDYFRVEGRWNVEEDGDEQRPGCILRVYTNVAFSKKTMWKGKIVQSTVEECREAYETWIDLANEVLKQKNLEKEDGSTSKLISHEQVPPEKLETTQPQRVDHKTSDEITSEIIPPDVKDLRRADVITLQRNVGEASVGSLLRDTITKACISLKHQNTSSLLLVIFIAVILVLMQISILVLLSRPQRIVVVPQSDYCTHKMNGNGGEALALLNTQIKYLKEEMNFVETILDKLQTEHSQLKAKLNDLELFGNQRF